MESNSKLVSVYNPAKKLIRTIIRSSEIRTRYTTNE